MSASTIVRRAVQAKATPSITGAEALAVIRIALDRGFSVAPEADCWLVLRKGRREVASIDLIAPTWVDDLSAFLDAWDLVDMARHGDLAYR